MKELNIENSNYSSASTNSNMMEFVIATYKLLTATLVAATVGAYIGVQYNSVLSNYYIGLIILVFALFLGINFTKTKPGLNLILLFGCTFISGLTLGPVLTATLSMVNGAEIVSNAFLLTAVAFCTLTMYGMTTKNNLLGFGKYLIIALVVLMVASLLNIFFMSSMFSLVISSLAAILFSVFIVYDTQRIYSGEFDTPVEAALSMYINVLNLFISLLNILRITSKED